MVFSFVIVSSIILSAVSYCKVYALAGYSFDFTLPENLLNDGHEMIVQFNWNIKNFDMVGQKRLTVKPFISAGAVEIYNEKLKKFIGLADFNNTLPYLEKEVVLKFKGVRGLETPAYLHFTIYDTLTGQKYETPDKKVWGAMYYREYTDLLNENIIKTIGDDTELAEPSANTSDVLRTEPEDPITLYLWYLAPALFFYGLLKSPNGFG